MPTWLKCRDCKEKFYTAKSEFQLDKEERCYRCNGILDKICRHIEQVLEEDDLVEVLLTPGREDRRARVEVDRIEDDYIDMRVKDGHVSHDRVKKEEIVEVRFTREAPRPGRYSFRSKLLDYDGEEDVNIYISRPDHAIHHQERRAPRFSINTKAKYSVAENEEDLETRESFESGETLDISVSGVLVAAESASPENLKENRPVKLKLELENHELEIDGRIARVTELEKAEKRQAGMGIEFTGIGEDEQSILREFQSQKLRS